MNTGIAGLHRIPGEFFTYSGLHNPVPLVNPPFFKRFPTQVRAIQLALPGVGLISKSFPDSCNHPGFGGHYVLGLIICIENSGSKRLPDSADCRFTRPDPSCNAYGDHTGFSTVSSIRKAFMNSFRSPSITPFTSEVSWEVR